jgi:hypothetical protein
MGHERRKVSRALHVMPGTAVTAKECAASPDCSPRYQQVIDEKARQRKCASRRQSHMACEPVTF